MPSRCEFKINQSEKGYFVPGEVITGRVELHLDKPKRIKSFELVFRGEANVIFYKNSVVWDGYGKIFKHEIPVMPECLGPFELSAGIYGFSFSYQLPESSYPSSMSCAIGNIRYFAIARANKPGSCCTPWMTSPIMETVDFQIFNKLDLNQSASILRKPFRHEIRSEKPCEQEFRLELPVTGYVPGEIIPITVTLNIKSNHKARSIKSTLTQKIIYASTLVSKVTEKVVEGVCTPLPEGKHFKIVQNLKVPLVPPSELVNVLNVHYILETTIDTNAWFCSDPRMKIPIFIGTVPFTSSPTAPDSSTSP